nr:septal ring lytic transglycosylase RlpA family protein [Larsenimonas rhizosphaerae]
MALALALTGCASSGGGAGSSSSGGRYHLDKDGYPEDMLDMSHVKDAVPRKEPRSASGNRPTYSVWGKTYHVLPNSNGYSATGLASFYGTKFQGYATASGELYDMYQMTAAHKTLPLPTYARVTNLDNGKSVIVKVNDRGPFHDDRLIDLSYAAAYRLDILHHGTGRVRVDAIDPDTWKQAAPVKQAAGAVPAAVSNNRQAAAAGNYFVQVAALKQAAQAEQMRQQLAARVAHPVRVIHEQGVYKVQVGPLADRIVVQSTKSALGRAGYPQAFTVSPSE